MHRYRSTAYERIAFAFGLDGLVSRLTDDFRKLLALCKHLHPLAWQWAADAEGLLWKIHSFIFLHSLEVNCGHSVTDKTHSQLQVAMTQFFIEKEYFRTMSLTVVTILKLLQCITSPCKLLLVYCESHINCRILEKVWSLGCFGVENRYFYFLERIRHLLCH